MRPERKWEVIFYEDGEEPLTEIMNNFQDAWALAQPNPQEDGLAWTTLNRANVMWRFDNGETWIVVSRASENTYTVIRHYAA